MNAILGGGGFHHVCIKTRDWDRSLRFYQETLGCTAKIAWNIGGAGPRATMLDTGDGNYIELFDIPDYVPAPNGSIVHFALRTTRLDEVAARVRAAGAKITVEPKDVTIATTNGAGSVQVRLFFCEGPSGEIIEFFQNSAT
jgi:glyoxylase I family protein